MNGNNFEFIGMALLDDMKLKIENYEMDTSMEMETVELEDIPIVIDEQKIKNNFIGSSDHFLYLTRMMIVI
jgi:hypothetical protein